MNMISHQVPLLNCHLLLIRQISKDQAKMPLELTKYGLFSKFRDEYNMIFTLPCCMTQLFVIHTNSPSISLGRFTEGEFLRLLELSNFESPPAELGVYRL